MTEIYCDIVPQPTGWSFTVDGASSATFPSYMLAFEAARQYRDTAGDDRKLIVLRHLDLKGQLRRLPPSSRGFAPPHAHP